MRWAFGWGVPSGRARTRCFGKPSSVTKLSASAPLILLWVRESLGLLFALAGSGRIGPARLLTALIVRGPLARPLGLFLKLGGAARPGIGLELCLGLTDALQTLLTPA